jgi:hypothetical protein
MCSNRLQLNVGKTDLWYTTSRRQHQLPAEAPSLGGYDILPSQLVRKLGACLDADLSLRSHIDVIVSRYFTAPIQLRSVRRHVAAPMLHMFVSSLALMRLDYCNSRLPDLSPSRSVDAERCKLLSLQYASP